MRVTFLMVAAALALPAAASADTVLVMNPDSTGELNAAMRVAMAGRGTEVASTPAPAGDVRLQRAASAQRAAAQSGATAAVWIDSGEVCAVTPDGRDFRHAPFPVEARSARAFAAIAASLVDEMVGPAPWGGVDIDIDVQVHGTGNARVRVDNPSAAPVPPQVAAIEMPAPMPPGADAPSVVGVLPRRETRAHAGHSLVSIGPMLTPLTYGLEGGIAFPLSPDWRFALTAMIDHTYTDSYILGVGVLELTHIGAGLDKHWDVGPLAGWAEPDRSESAMFAGLRVSRTYEVGDSAVSVSLAPILMHVTGDGDGTTPVFPAVWGSVRWQLAL